MSSSGEVAPGYGSGRAASEGEADSGRREQPSGAVAAPPLRQQPQQPSGPLPAAPPGPGGPSGPRRGKGPKPRRPVGQRVLRWAVVVLAVLLVLAGAVYGYVRYRWSQIQSVACTSCTAAGSGPFNVLIVGSDTRAGNTGQATKSFGSSSQVAGQRSDTVKILHVDPATGTARLLSIPRDTYVEMPPSVQSVYGRYQKINTAFNDGINPLVQTIEDTFGISISHFVMVDFQGLTSAVDTVGGIYLNFPYPARDNDNGNNNSGLSITQTGCQKLNGTMTLALARSRYYQYYESGSWHYDPSSDIGRIERQNIVIQAIVGRARSSYNPLTLNAFLGALVHDVTVDKAMTIGDMFSLATTYHAFSPSSLSSYTLPVSPATSAAGDVEVVQQPQTEQLLTQFLGSAPGAVTTPPVDGHGSPVYPPASTGTSSPGGGGASGPGASGPGAGGSSGSSTSLSNPVPPYDPSVCSP